MPDINKITVSGFVVATWSYNGNLYAMLAIYDMAAPDEQTADLITVLRNEGVDEEHIDTVEAVLTQQQIEPQTKQPAHYATVRFERGVGPDNQPVTLNTGTRIYVTGKYHEDRASQNLLTTIRKCGISTNDLPERWRREFQTAHLKRPSPYIIPEGFAVLGYASRKALSPTSIIPESTVTMQEASE